MRSYYIKTYGCQMNTSDSERITSVMRACGFALAPSRDAADVVIFNTCSVRQSAEDRVYGQLHAIEKDKTIGKKQIVVVTGCMAKRPQVKKTAKGVDIFLDIKDLAQLPSLLGVETVMENEDYFGITPSFGDTSTAYVPISTGCDNFCTYCIVPYTRGREESREPDAIICEVTEALSRGYKEIFLLGQNVNAYSFGFPDLLRRLNQLSGDFWIRFVSSHPKDISPELIAAWGEGGHITPYVHFALQSGDDEILAKMNRRYTREEFLAKVALIRQAVSDVFLATDIIVGFPGETEQQFAKTIEAMEKAAFDMVYINQYSPRKGTPSAEYEDSVTSEQKHHREAVLNDLLTEISLDHHRACIGRTVSVLISGIAKDGRAIGKDYSYRTVKVTGPADALRANSFVTARVIDADTFGLIGEYVSE